jgi:dTDP-4-amino-4,6-dideoxygalactose transaminase
MPTPDPTRGSAAHSSFIPQAAPGLRIARHRDEIDAAIASVVAGGRYILGEAVESFEAAFARFLDAPFAIGVNSGTDALSLALLTLGVAPGDEVIVPALTAAATAVAVQRIGAVVRFVDVEPATRGIDPSALAGALSSRTAAVIVVHLHGMPARLTEICRIAAVRGLAVIEDCAHAHGATIDGRMVGTLGDAAAFSFYPTKNLGALGDAGAVVVHSVDHAERARRLRHHGQDCSELCTMAGMNSRLDEIQAAVLRVLLPYLAAENKMRHGFARCYDEMLAPLVARGVKLPASDPGAVFHQYAIELDERDRVRDALRAQGIGTAVHYAPGLHRHPALCGDGPRPECPVTDRLADTLLSLPIQPELMSAQDRIVAALLDIVPGEASRGSRP